MALIKSVNGVSRYMTPEEEESFLREKREQAAARWREDRVSQDDGYGSIHDQLGQLWDDIDAGLFGTTAKKSKWYQKIRAVKARYPKPAGTNVDTPDDFNRRGVK